MSPFKEKKGQGLLGFFGLHDWFRGLSKKEQSAIRKIYEETSGEDASDLDSVEIETSETAQGFLGSIAIGLIAQKDYALGELVLQKALSLTSPNPWDRHFIYDSLIEIYYKRRDEESNAVDKCIKYCIDDIEIAEDVVETHKKDMKYEMRRRTALDRLSREQRVDFYVSHEEYPPGYYDIPPIPDEEIPIPRIPSFDRLAIIYEKQGNYQAAIQVCQRAIELGTPSSTKGGFTGRLAKLEKKLQTTKP